MRALVTGSAGFIGSTLTQTLLAAGHEVTGVDSFTPYYDRPIKEANISTFRNKSNFTLLEGDLREHLAPENTQGIDVVFHQAAQPGVRGSWESGFDEHVDLNIVSTQKLMEAVRLMPKPPKVVYASSSSVYGQLVDECVDERSATRPYSPYGVTKLAGERLVLAYADNYGIDVACLRYFTVYGPRQRPDMAMHRLLASALTSQEFPLYGTGSQVRDFTYVQDVVAANVLAGSKETPNKVYNICGGSSVSLAHVISVVGHLIGHKPTIRAHGHQPGDVDRTGGDGRRAKDELGWVPAVSLEDGLQAELDWLRNSVGVGHG